MRQINKSSLRTFILVLKFLIFIAAIYVIYQKLSHIDKKVYFTFFENLISQKSGLLVLLVVVLMAFLNWDLESRKWSTLVRPFQKLTYLNSYKAVLAGSAVSFVSPNRSGSFIGRILFLNEEDRARGTAMSVLGGFAQTLVSLIVGLISLALFLFPKDLLEHRTIIIFLGTLATIVFFILYFRSAWISKIPSNNKIIGQITGSFSQISAYTRWKVFGLSFIRYLIFSLQFALLLSLTDLDLQFSEILTSVFMIYFIMGLLPSLWLGNLGPRELISVLVISSFSHSNNLTDGNLDVIFPSLMLWLVNLCVPAIIGYFILLFKPFKA